MAFTVCFDRILRKVSIIVAIAFMATVVVLAAARQHSSRDSATTMRDAKAKEDLNLRALRAFEPNAGQDTSGARFIARDGRSRLLLRDASVTLVGAPGEMTMRWLDSTSSAAPEGRERFASHSNYFIGRPPDWRLGVPHFGAVRYTSVYPGIDLLFYRTEGLFEFDFVVRPGADPTAIRLAFDGAESVVINDDGSLGLNSAGSQMVLSPPRLWQRGGARATIDGRFRLNPDGTVGFEVGPYDADRELVIDPAIVFSTYFGGTGREYDSDVAVDRKGNVYLTGTTASADFPTKAALDGTLDGADCFISRFNKRGKLLVSTYFGGSEEEYSCRIDVDSVVYLAGTTLSSDLPTVDPVQAALADQGTPEGDAFLAVFSDDLSQLLSSTYHGGEGRDALAGLSAGTGGRIALVGSTESKKFPLANATQKRRRGAEDSWVSVFEPLAADARPGARAGDPRLIFSTFLGGQEAGFGAGETAFAVDFGKRLTVSGAIYGSSAKKFPLVNPLWRTVRGLSEMYLTVFDLDATPRPEIVFSTLIGGDHLDEALGVDADSSGRLYLAGATFSVDYPLEMPLESVSEGNGCAVLTVFDLSVMAQPRIVFSTYWACIGGAATHVKLRENGEVVLGGWTSGTPLLENPLQSEVHGFLDPFVAVFGPIDEALPPDVLFSTLLGGHERADLDFLTGMAIDRQGAIYLAGISDALDYPTKSALQKAPAGGTDAVLTKIKR